MISKEAFDVIEKKHGKYASWAVWMDEREGHNSPSDNIDNLSIFSLDKNPHLLEILKPNIVMVGIGFGGNRGHIDPELLKDWPSFWNFHYKGQGKKDHKLRYVFRNTDFYGAYMTDLIKYYSAVNPDMDYLNDPIVKEKSKEIFDTELKDLGAKPELIIAFGDYVYNTLVEFYSNDYNIKKVLHYSHSKANNKDEYKKIVIGTLKNWKK